VARQSVRVERRFRSEIRLARRVRHRNVCSVYGDGVDGGLLYICMELVEGENLARRIRRSGALPPEEAWDAVRQVADGLRAIHQAGIVHRDLKTGNLMMDAEGVVRVMDFGIAKHHVPGPEAGTVTVSSALVGTPEYMSPEQLRGEPVDFRSDLYAFGVVVYELFTGTLPFRRPSRASPSRVRLRPSPNAGPTGRRLRGRSRRCRRSPGAPLARIASGVIGVGALAAHLLAASGVRGPAGRPATLVDARARGAVAPSPSSPEASPPVVATAALSARPAAAAAQVKVAPAVDTSRIYGRDEVDVPPRRVSGEGASYPKWGPPLKRGKRVSITATFVVTKNGDVTDIRVEKGERGLEAVLVEISRWKFEPGRKDGVPVKVRIEATHTFIGG
jgi:serine/threonine protein kinase